MTDASSLFPDDPASLLVDPTVAGPDLLFSTGTVVNGAEQFSPVLPSVLGNPDTAWNVTQWNTPAAGIFAPADPAPAGTIQDPLLGGSLASWLTSGDANASSAFAVFGVPGALTYRLAASGGTLRDTFLQTTGYAPATLTFDQDLVFDVQERVATASAGGGNAYAFNGFTVFFNLPGSPHYDPSLFTTEIFLQAPLTDSRGEPGAYSTLRAGQDWQAIFDLSATTVSASGTGNDASVATLGFESDAGNLHDVRLDLSAAMRRMTAVMAGLDPALAADLTDLSRWSLGSVYVGVESNGDGGTDPAALAIDVADPEVFAAPDGDAGIGGAVQSIDAGGYAVPTAAARITTADGTVNTLQLSGTGTQEVFSGGQDLVLVGDGRVAILHGSGAALAVQGSAAASGSVAVDGTAPIRVSGSFHDLSVTTGADDTLVTGTVTGHAVLALSGTGDAVVLDGNADAVLAGDDAAFAAGGGTVSLSGADAAIDQNGGGEQTVFLDGLGAFLTQDGTGEQVIVGSPTAGGAFTVSGGSGTQWVWSGNAAMTATAAADNAPGAALDVIAQSGSNTSLALGGETAFAFNEGGSLSVLGTAVAGGATATVFPYAGTTVISGGAENLVAVMAGGT